MGLEINPDKAWIWCDFKETFIKNPNTYIANTESSQTGKLDVYVVRNNGRAGGMPDNFMLGGGSSGGTDLLVDGNMQAADASAYSAANGAILSKQSASPRSGQCLRIAYSDNSGPQAYQNILTQAKTYRVKGWARCSTSGISAFVLVGSASGAVTVANSTQWTYFDFTKIVPGGSGTWLYLFGSVLSAGQYIEFDDVSCEEIVSNTNYPSQNTNQRGLNFKYSNLNQRINCGSLSLERNQPFTMAFCTKLTDSNGGDLFSTYDQAGSPGIFVSTTGTGPSGGSIMISIINNAGANNYLQIRGPLVHYKIGKVLTAIITYSGNSSTTGIVLYENGIPLVPTVNVNALTQSIITTNPIYVGCRKNGTSWASQYIGKLYHMSVFPRCFSQVQVKQLHNTIMRGINSP